MVEEREKMAIYQNLDGDSEVHSFEIKDDNIIVEFVDGGNYKYTNQKPLMIHLNNIVEISCTADLKWNDIKWLLRYNIFSYHWQNSGKGATFYEKLGTTTNLYFTYRERLIKQGYHLPNLKEKKPRKVTPAEPELQDFIHQLPQKDYFSAFNALEKYIVMAAFKKCVYSRSETARFLGISYIAIMNKFKKWAEE